MYVRVYMNISYIITLELNNLPGMSYLTFYTYIIINILLKRTVK